MEKCDVFMVFFVGWIGLLFYLVLVDFYIFYDWFKFLKKFILYLVMKKEKVIRFDVIY